MSGRGATVTVVTTVGTADGLVETAAVEAVSTTGSGTPVLVEILPARRRTATVLATAAAKQLEAGLRDLEPDCHVVARGALCVVQIGDKDSVVDAVAGIVRSVGSEGALVIAAPPTVYRQVVEGLDEVDRIVLRTDPVGEGDDDSLLEIAVDEAADLAEAIELVERAPGRIAGRRALAGSGVRARGRKPGRFARLAGERGQATPLVLGAVFVLVVGAVVLVAIAGAITGKGRAQRAADLSALSAARSMKDDLPRLLAPPTLPNGLPNPEHMPKPVYLARARLTAVRIATSNGASPLTASVSFPDAFSYAPVRARVTVRLRTDGSGPADPVRAEAQVGAPISMGAVPATVSGDGYNGQLAERQGEGMRPDVAAAFDRLAAAASAAGVTVAVNSGYRSNAEQAVLFAANPDPRMVAPPGSSLHRCGTELDLGPPSAYGWLAANAGRFGFVQRYSWEAWHFGYSTGPAPCSGAGNSVTAGGERGSGLSSSVPAFVPARFKPPILRAAMKWGVSAALLSAQLYAESGFNPNAGSSAGAQGIAQFMPGTAAAYGLGNPFDPVAAIDAQGHLMSDLLKQFGSPALALAAYNAGPGAVGSCNCIPPYPETQAYVARILAQIGSAAAALPLPMEIELVD